MPSTITHNGHEQSIARRNASRLWRDCELLGHLGGYGEPLDPDGDIHAMNELRTLLHPSGILLVAIPCGVDDVIDVQQYSRIYSGKRLPLLLRGWDYAGTVHGRQWSPNISLSPINDRAWKPILVLRHATPHSHCTLNCTNADAHNHSCRPTVDCPLFTVER